MQSLKQKQKVVIALDDKNATARECSVCTKSHGSYNLLTENSPLVTVYTN